MRGAQTEKQMGKSAGCCACVCWSVVPTAAAGPPAAPVATESPSDSLAASGADQAQTSEKRSRLGSGRGAG